MKTTRGLKLAAIVAALAFVLVLGWLLPIGVWTVTLADRVRGAGAAGVLLFTAAYVAATVALLPGSLLTLAAGFAYGPIGGLLVASPASVLAATTAFLLGRTALRGWVQRKIADAPRTRALSRAVGRDSFRLILLLRLSPVVPFNILNYALGVSEASFSRYVVASFIGMLPGTWLYVYLGSLATTAAELTDASRGGGPRQAGAHGRRPGGDGPGGGARHAIRTASAGQRVTATRYPIRIGRRPDAVSPTSPTSHASR